MRGRGDSAYCHGRQRPISSHIDNTGVRLQAVEREVDCELPECNQSGPDVIEVQVMQQIFDRLCHS